MPQTSPRPAIADFLALATCMLSTLFVGLWFWQFLRESALFFLMFVCPAMLGGLLLLWRYRVDVKSQPSAFLAGVFAFPVYLCWAPLYDMATRWHQSATMQRDFVPRWLVAFSIYIVLPGCAYGLARWCRRRLQGAFVRLAFHHDHPA
jgi:hypothetical protein